MKDFFKFLPAEITTNILLKLSVRSVAVSKCVCKQWLQFLESDDFMASHFAQSAPALALSMWTEDSNQLKLFELEENELDLDLGSHLSRQLYTLRDSLSLCDESSEGEGIAVWMMKEYGVEKSWTKEYVIDLGLGVPELQWFHPVKVYENGDVLYLYEKAFFYYSKKTKSSREVGGVFGAEEEFEYQCITSHLHTSSMVSLEKCFGSVENVISF